jgi:hypothetical protein
MHEFGLCEGVLDAVRQRADGRRVTGVRVRHPSRPDPNQRLLLGV